ncbi:MAG: HYR domain-containing protein, partial [Luteolibacter sp.]
TYGSQYAVKTYTIPAAKVGLYRIYRLDVSANNGGTFLQIAELGLFSPPTDQGDKTPPVFGATPDLTVNTTSVSGTSVSYGVLANDDAGGAIQATCTPASGSVFPVGSTTVNCTAIDLSGNSATASFTVTIINTSGPAFISAPSINMSGGVASITVGSLAGRNYQLQRSYTLVTGSWENIGPAKVGGTLLEFSDTPDPLQKRAFYRIIVTP